MCRNIIIPRTRRKCNPYKYVVKRITPEVISTPGVFLVFKFQNILVAFLEDSVDRI